MLWFLPPIPDAAGRSPWALALIAVELTLPLVIVVLALVPALMICPFLSNRHQRLVLSLVASLRRWAVGVTGSVQRDSSQENWHHVQE